MSDDGGEELAVELRQMWEAQRDLGRKAMGLALRALDNADPATIPVNIAVQLLKLGADLERRAMLGIEPEGDDDPFSKLAGSA